MWLLGYVAYKGVCYMLHIKTHEHEHGHCHVGTYLGFLVLMKGNLNANGSKNIAHYCTRPALSEDWQMCAMVRRPRIISTFVVLVMGSDASKSVGNHILINNVHIQSCKSACIIYHLTEWSRHFWSFSLHVAWWHCAPKGRADTREFCWTEIH